ncbi:MAG: hypothetical protein NTX53_12760 [candidate division WOR-3 bacterium]|nr:hypothetical protein [candidate division WOR-3 bacterium]
MKAYELPAKITPEGNLEPPERLRRLLPAGKAARVIVLIPDPADADEQNVWERLTAVQFCSGYAAADAVYDRP